jgi:hypothetical protein
LPNIAPNTKDLSAVFWAIRPKPVFSTGAWRKIASRGKGVRVIVIVHECDLVGLGLDSGPILGNPDRDWDNIAISKM